MSTLPAQQIAELAQLKGMIEPFAERTVERGKTYGIGPSTYDFRCKQHLVIYPWIYYKRYLCYQAIDWVRDKLKLPKLYGHYRCGFTLASSIERVKLPNDIEAHVMDKSSWARKGLSVFNTHFDPGFVGYPTLELANHGPHILEVHAGMAICQFKFGRMAERTDMPYKGRYQHQPDKPVPAIEAQEVWS